MTATIVMYDDADDLDREPVEASGKKYILPMCEPTFDRVRGDGIISNEQFEREKAQIASGERTMEEIFAEYGLDGFGRKGPNYVPPRSQS